MCKKLTIKAKTAIKTEKDVYFLGKIIRILASIYKAEN